MRAAALGVAGERVLRANWRAGRGPGGLPYAYTCPAPPRYRHMWHLLDARRYLAPVGIPSVSMDEPSFCARFDRFRAWRGPSWMNTAWLLVPAMARLGYGDEATRIVDGLARATEQHGFREYYDPLTGRGLGARGFGWSTLLVDLLAGSPHEGVFRDTRSTTV